MLPVAKKYDAYTEEIVTILPNLHISVDGTYYSIPYMAYKEGKMVTVRSYADRVEIYQNGTLIASHRRTSDRYRTVESHMPPPDKLGSLQWNSNRLRRWASGIGPQTYRVVNGILGRYAIEQQGYMKCITILNMADRYGAGRLENACVRVNDAAVLQAYKIIRDYICPGKNI